MTLGWDILLDSVSIKEKVRSFSLVRIKGAYANELNLYIADKDFYDSIGITTIPSLRIEVKTKIASTWISQGFFFIEQPISQLNKDGSTSPGVWGRSKTALAGSPFVTKVSKSWTEDTNALTIINEMADLCGLTVISEINNYEIFANAYVADNMYPIDVITQIVNYIGGYVSCNPAGNLILKESFFHPVIEDYSIDDDDIIDLSEISEFPKFGNRIRIGALGSGAGISVNLMTLDNDDCLPANGTSVGTLLAFVLGMDGRPVQDNTIVFWEAEDGVTLSQTHTATGDYLLSNKKHKASNYYDVSVDYPIKEVIGVWAYSDLGNKNNFWEEEYGSFTDNVITTRKPFSYCDQSLRITYITSGCAVNKITAGLIAKDVEVTANVEGAIDALLIKLGNTCACGSSLNAKINPPDDVCLGNLAHILIWATISGIPATGQKIEARLTKGCGQLSSENKILKSASILNESSYVENVISGVSQVSVEIDISGAQLPSVYRETDTGKTNNLYSSYDGKVIDLNSILSTGTKVFVNYHAEGTTLISWRTLGATKDCDAEVTISMADGTESGLHDVVSLRAKDCTIEPVTPPEYDEDISPYDPVYSDGGADSSGGFEDTGNPDDTEPDRGTVDPCFTTVMNRVLNSENATNDEELDAIRFGTKSAADCPQDGEFDCPCSELCTSEVMSEGNIMSEDRTIHDVVSDTYEKGTPEYNEEFALVMDTNIAACSEDCEANRLEACGSCDTVTGPASLAPGDSAEYTCSNGVSEIVTMPIDHCGIYEATVGCCTVKIRSTDGQWVCISDNCTAAVWKFKCQYNTTYTEYSIASAGPEFVCAGGCPTSSTTDCDSDVGGECMSPCPDQMGACPIRCVRIIGRTPVTYEWQCI